MTRLAVTEKIIETKVRKQIQWKNVAATLELSKEWVTAGCLGQMAFSLEEAQKIGAIFDLDDMDIKWLQEVPYKGSYDDAKKNVNANLIMMLIISITKNTVGVIFKFN